MLKKPENKPKNPCFSSGPCAKRSGWCFDNLDHDILGRSHRSSLAKKKFDELYNLTRSLLDIPSEYKIILTPASDTGAVEMAMWNLLGAPDIGVDVFAWERFSRLWLEDITHELHIKDRRAFEAIYGQLPDLSLMEPDRDAVFAWNGTTSGAYIANPEWVSVGSKGLRICDATSAVFAYDMPWDRLDVVTWSWQKVMGGEAQHGMMVLSPKAIERLKTYKPNWPIPKIFKFHDDEGNLNTETLEGSPINTPSLMCVVDALDSLRWMKKIGGRKEIQVRIHRNATALDHWVTRTPWIDYLTQDPAIRSKTSVCLALRADLSPSIIDNMVKLLEQESVAYDLKAYKTAPAGLRIWCGTTVETDDIIALTDWLDWSFLAVTTQ